MSADKMHFIHASREADAAMLWQTDIQSQIYEKAPMT